METPLVHEIPAVAARRSALRVGAVSVIGPVTFAVGVIWGMLQPYRVTFLHPRGQGLWWLLIEPPLLVGRGADAGGRRGARPRARPARVAAVAADVAAGLRGHRNGVHRARTEPVVLRSLGVPASPHRLDVPHRVARPARTRAAAAV